MSIFIKAGLWLEKKTGYKGEFNLTRYITDLIASTPPAPPALPYKVYTALLTQSNQGDPNPTVLENTIGETLTWQRISAGTYILNSEGKFTNSKTAIVRGEKYIKDIAGTSSKISIYSEVLNTNQITVITSVGNTPTDGMLYLDFYEIRVYN